MEGASVWVMALLTDDEPPVVTADSVWGVDAEATVA
jgi:hypothetical protein